MVAVIKKINLSGVSPSLVSETGACNCLYRGDCPAADRLTVYIIVVFFCLLYSKSNDWYRSLLYLWGLVFTCKILLHLFRLHCVQIDHCRGSAPKLSKSPILLTILCEPM